MTPLEKQVKQVLDDDALSEAKRVANIEALTEQHGRDAVKKAVKHWIEVQAAWGNSLLDEMERRRTRRPRPRSQ